MTTRSCSFPIFAMTFFVRYTASPREIVFGSECVSWLNKIATFVPDSERAEMVRLAVREWIGPSRPGIGDGAGSRRRKSGRVSRGPDVKGPDATSEMSENRERAGVHKSWTEGRPIY